MPDGSEEDVGNRLRYDRSIGVGCGWLYWRFFPPCGQPAEDPNVEVIVSDCTRPFLISTSPDGKYLMYADDRGYWLRNLITGEEQKMSVAADFWLTDTLALQTTGGGDNRQFLVYDLTDGTKTPLQWIYGRHNFAGVLPAFQQAEIYCARSLIALFECLMGR